MSECSTESIIGDRLTRDDDSEVKHSAGTRPTLTHLFVELTSLDELSFPTSSSTRIKYTCLDASSHYLAVGSTSGTVYLFSRFASKHRNRLSSVPVQVISIKDGPVIKLSISPDEKYLATASRRGSLTITALAGIGQNPITLFSTDCHVGTDENGQSTYVTELCWCSNSSQIYAGDTKGRISRTRIHSRNFFRPPSEILFDTDSEIVQLDLHDDCSLLASTLTRCCICDLKNHSCIQVGKRLRNGHFGAVFYSDQRKRKLLYEKNEEFSVNESSSDLTVIFASRPHGRLWESNGIGVVYSTHQYRNLKIVSRFPVVSFKEDVVLMNDSSTVCGSNVAGDNDEIRSISFGRLALIKCQGTVFLLTKTSTSFCLIDPSDSHMVLISNVNSEDSVCEYAVAGADVFLLSSRTGSLRKLTLFTLEKAVEKLHWRQCYLQAAQVIYANYITSKSSDIRNYELLEDILNKIAVPECKARLAANVIETLRKLLSEMKKTGDGGRRPRATVCRLNSGIHCVVQFMESSGYEDDFTFRAPSPLRPLRSKSTPHMEITHGWKRRSLPLNERTVMRTTGDGMGEPEDPEERRRKLINEARMLLLDVEKVPSNQLTRNGSLESLRTLLDCSNTFIMFDQQVTISDITKDLEAAKKFLRLIGDKKWGVREQEQREWAAEKIDFKSFFGRSDPLEILDKCVETMPLSINVNVARLRTVRRTRKGARIIKGIKPCGKRNVVAGIKTDGLKEDGQFSQRLIQRDPSSSESLNLNCNGGKADVEETLKRNSGEQSTSGTEIGLLNKSYVVEKNFVAVRPIEVTWTMNGDAADEDNDLVSMASSATAVTTLNDGETGDERLMQSSEVTVTPSTIVSQSKDLTGNNSAHCHICGLHSQWCHVMIFGPKMSQLRVTVDHFADGGVPTTMEQWVELFEYRRAFAVTDPTTQNESNLTERLCDHCAVFFEFDESLKQKALAIREMVERIERRDKEKKGSENLVLKTAKSWDEDFVYNVFFKDILIRPEATSGIRRTTDVSSPDSNIPKPELNLSKGSRKFSWLPAVTISQLLLCMRYCEGSNAVFDFLKNNKTLFASLTIEDWQWLAVMKAYECTRHFDLMPKEVVADLLIELKISTIEDVGTTSFSTSVTTESSASSGVSNSRSTTGSLTVSVDGNCPCCTLPLKMRVSHSNGYITVFRCGHLYHQICLREANLSLCIRCEIERRRHRHLQRQRQIGSISGVSVSSQRSLASGTGNPRSIPIKAVRTTVTSPPAWVKAPRRT